MSNVFYSITNYILFNARKKLYGQFDLAKINHQLLAFSRDRGKTEPRNRGARYNDIILFARNESTTANEILINSTTMAVGNRKRTIVGKATSTIPHIGASTGITSDTQASTNQTNVVITPVPRSSSHAPTPSRSTNSNKLCQ